MKNVLPLPSGFIPEAFSKQNRMAYT